MSQARPSLPPLEMLTSRWSARRFDSGGGVCLSPHKRREAGGGDMGKYEAEIFEIFGKRCPICKKEKASVTVRDDKGEMTAVCRACYYKIKF